MTPFVGQIQAFGFNFAPRGWAFCQGQLLAISSNTALFSLLGTTFGGDGRTSFGLPDLRGRAMIAPGNGPGLSNYSWGQRGGAEMVQLTTAQMPSHNHSVALGGAGSSPAGKDSLLGNVTGADTIYNNTASGDHLGSGAVANSGGGQSHENRMPYLAIYQCIALQGVYPSRS